MSNNLIRGRLDSFIRYLASRFNSNGDLTIEGDLNMPFEYTTTVSDIIVASSATTIASASYVRWGKVAMIYINWTNKNAITVPATGNITNVVVGTIVEGKRPKFATSAHSYGDNAGAAWYYMDSTGAVHLGACEGTGASRTIAAGQSFQACHTYILI